MRGSSSFHNGVDLFVCCCIAVSTSHLQTEHVSSDSLLCMICHDTPLLLSVAERGLHNDTEMSAAKCGNEIRRLFLNYNGLIGKDIGGGEGERESEEESPQVN